MKCPRCKFKGGTKKYSHSKDYTSNSKFFKFEDWFIWFLWGFLGIMLGYAIRGLI